MNATAGPILGTLLERIKEIRKKHGIPPSVLRMGPQLYRRLMDELETCKLVPVPICELKSFQNIPVEPDLGGVPNGFSFGVFTLVPLPGTKGQILTTEIRFDV